MMKKFLKTAAIFLMTLFIGVCIGKGGVEAKAAVSQTDAQKTTATVTWTAERNGVSYNVYMREYSQQDFVFVANTPELSYTLTGLKPATKYVVKAAAVKDKNLASAILTAAEGDGIYKLYSGGNN